MERVYLIVYLDLVGYSKNNEPIQISQFKSFQKEIHHLLYEEIVDQTCILIPTGDGVIAGIENVMQSESFKKTFHLVEGVIVWSRLNDCNVRCAIHVGEVNILKDVNFMKNIVGHTINDASRILAGANDNGIVISKAFFDKFLNSVKYQAGMNNTIDAVWTFSVSDEDVVVDKHNKEHSIYNLILMKHGEEVGSRELLLPKYLTKVYSTDYPKAENLRLSFTKKVEKAQELDFVGIYHPSLPSILENLSKTPDRRIVITILYAAEDLSEEIKEFFKSDQGNLALANRAKSIERVQKWHSGLSFRESVELRMYEYTKVLPFGASMVDKSLKDRGFIHVSNYLPEIVPSATPYLEIEWKTTTIPPLYGFYSDYLGRLLRGDLQRLVRI